MLRLTLITVSHFGNILLTLALPGLLVTAPAIVNRPQGAAGALLASVRVLRGEVPVPRSAVITADPTDESLAVTLTRGGSRLQAGHLVTLTLVSRSIRLTVALSADVRVRYIFIRVLRGGRGESEVRESYSETQLTW